MLPFFPVLFYSAMSVASLKYIQDIRLQLQKHQLHKEKMLSLSDQCLNPKLHGSTMYIYPPEAMNKAHAMRIHKEEIPNWINCLTGKAAFTQQHISYFHIHGWDKIYRESLRGANKRLITKEVEQEILSLSNDLLLKVTSVGEEQNYFYLSPNSFESDINYLKLNAGMIVQGQSDSPITLAVATHITPESNLYCAYNRKSGKLLIFYGDGFRATNICYNARLDNFIGRNLIEEEKGNLEDTEFTIVHNNKVNLLSMHDNKTLEESYIITNYAPLFPRKYPDLFMQINQKIGKENCNIIQATHCTINLKTGRIIATDDIEDFFDLPSANYPAGSYELIEEYINPEGNLVSSLNLSGESGKSFANYYDYTITDTGIWYVNDF